MLFPKKVKAVHVHALMAYRRSRGTAPLNPNLGTRWRFVVKFIPPAPFCPVIQFRYPLNRKLGGTHYRSERLAEEKMLSPLPVFESRTAQSAAMSRYRLCYPGSCHLLKPYVYTLLGREAVCFG
jgi:hypothetical protein